MWSKAECRSIIFFGSVAYAKVPSEKCRKFDDKAIVRTFIGYDENCKAYCLIDLKTNKVIISRDVKFSEKQSARNANTNTLTIDLLVQSSPDSDMCTPSSDVRGEAIESIIAESELIESQLKPNPRQNKGKLLPYACKVSEEPKNCFEALNRTDMATNGVMKWTTSFNR